jgi:hypothetical protein
MLHQTQKTSKSTKTRKVSKIPKKVAFANFKGKLYVPSEDRTQWVEVNEKDLPLVPLNKV